MSRRRRHVVCISPAQQQQQYLPSTSRVRQPQQNSFRIQSAKSSKTSFDVIDVKIRACNFLTYMNTSLIEYEQKLNQTFLLGAPFIGGARWYALLQQVAGGGDLVLFAGSLCQRAFVRCYSSTDRGRWLLIFRHLWWLYTCALCLVSSIFIEDR